MALSIRKIGAISLFFWLIALFSLSANAEQKGIISKRITGPTNLQKVWKQSLAMDSADIDQRDLTNRALREKVLSRVSRQVLKDTALDPVTSDYIYDSSTDGPWFRGWYTRITDETEERSIAVVGATQYLPNSTSSSEGDLPGYLAVIISENGQTTIYEAFPSHTSFWSNRELVLDDPHSSDWAEFQWDAVGYGTITNTYISIKIANEIEVNASLGERLPWNTRISWLGPEGLVEFLPFVPLHWFVYSLGSDADYSYTIHDDQESRDGQGFAHQETNSGTLFPPAWMWAQGVTDNNASQFALSGGELVLGTETLTTWLVSFHSPFIEWSFRQTIPGTVFVTTIDGCNGIFKMVAKDNLRKLVITAKAPTESFVPLSVPSEAGFVEGGEESFTADVTIKAYLQLPWFGDLLIEKRQFKNAALEFGGRYMCHQ